ncbi:MAG: ribonuclease P protein component [Saprospiraceae bacterium]|nr:ribonuclease P protein component [Saprospiraceae bacterium]
MEQRHRHTFDRIERLKSRKLIGQLFQDGLAVKAFPLRFIWKEISEEQSLSPVQFTVSVPKRRFKRAVDRNRLKRQIRESYRLRKATLYQQLPDGKRYVLLVLFVGSEKIPYHQIERAMEKGLRKWMDEFRARPTRVE